MIVRRSARHCSSDRIVLRNDRMTYRIDVDSSSLQNQKQTQKQYQNCQNSKVNKRMMITTAMRRIHDSSPSTVAVTILILLSSIITLSIIYATTKVTIFTLAYTTIPQQQRHHHHQHPHQQQCYQHNALRYHNTARSLQRHHHRPWLGIGRLWNYRDTSNVRCNTSSSSNYNCMSHNIGALFGNTASRQRNSRNNRRYSLPFTGLCMMNAKNEINSDEDSDLVEASDAPFFVSSSSSSATPSSTSTSTSTDTKVIENSATNIPSTSSSSTKTITTDPASTRRRLTTSMTSSTIDDPVLAMADSFVDVFTSVGKLFSNMFNGSNKNDNKSESNTIPAIDTTTTTTTTVSSDTGKTDKEPVVTAHTTMTELHSVNPTTETFTSSPVTIVRNNNVDNDKKAAFMNDIVTSILINEQQETIRPRLLSQEETVTLDDSTSETVATIITTTETITTVTTPNVNENDDDDDDPFHMTYKDDSDSVMNDYYNDDDDDDTLSFDSIVETSLESATASSTLDADATTLEIMQETELSDNVDTTTSIDDTITSSDSDVMVQEVNGWVTTTTSAASNGNYIDDDDDDDGGVVVVYDVNELDSWNQLISPSESTTDTDDDYGSDNDSITVARAATELEAMIITMTPSTDESDYFDENGNEILMTEPEDLHDVMSNSTAASTTEQLPEDTTSIDSVDATTLIDETITSNDSDVIVQEVNGWFTTTTSTASSGNFIDDDDDDGGVVVVYDVDELDSWNQPLLPYESTTDTDDDYDSDNDSTTVSRVATELEAMIITMTPSTDERDYVDENGNEILMTESEELDNVVRNSTPMSDELLDDTTSIPPTTTATTNDGNIDDINDVATTIGSTMLPPTTTTTSDTSASIESQPIENVVFESSDSGGNSANDEVVMVFDTDELDSWKTVETSNESEYVQLNATTLTITEVNADDEDDKNDYLEAIPMESSNEEFDDLVINAVESVVDDDENADEDAFSDEDWQASIQLAQQSMSDTISGMTIDFDDVADLGDDESESIDKFEWESAEQLAKSLNDAPTINTMENVDDSDVDMEALAKAAREAVEIFENKYENERKEKQLQREQWTRQQSSVSKQKQEDVSMPQTLVDMEATWNKMTLSELKDELGTRGLAKSGQKAKLVARLVEHQKLAYREIAGEGSTTPSFQGDASYTDELRDWTALKVADLKAELSRRGLPTSGKKAELVAALKESDATLENNGAPVESDLSNTNVNENIDEVAKAAREAVAMFERTNGKLGNEEDFDDIYDTADELIDEDEDISVDDFDLEALGKAVRDVVVQMEDDDDEPSDEALWEIENEIALVDESFLVPPEDDIELDMMIGNVETIVKTTPQIQQRTDPPPNYVSMAVSQLKEELNRRGLRVTGKKIDLIARLEASDNEAR